VSKSTSKAQTSVKARDFRPLFTWRTCIASKHSGLESTTRHLALTISLHMNERGGSCFPSMDSMAEETGLHKATVIRHLRILEEAGWLSVRRKKRPGRSDVNHYTALVPTAVVQLVSEEMSVRVAQDDPSSPERVAQDRGKGRTERPEFFSEDVNTLGAEQARTPEAGSKPPALRKARAPDPVWDAMVDACGLAGTSPTPGERGKWNKAAKDLRSAEATPEEIHRRAQTYRRRYPQTTITPLALSNNWAALGVDPSESNGVSEAEFRARKAAPWL
jgi:DNA-binding transcriptional ArsR family regulator